MNSSDISDQQRRSWNKFSPGWKKWDAFVMGWLNPIGERCIDLALLEDGHSVLDVATGTGEPGLSAAPLVGSGKVIGTDLAEEMVVIAKDKASVLGVDNYEALTCDVSSLPFDDSSFDAAICRHGVMFFPDTALCLGEIVRVLKPGGRLSLSAWGMPDANPWATTINGVVQQILSLTPPSADTPGIFRCAQPKTLTKLLDECGLSDIREVEVSGQLFFDSPEHYWEFMTDVAAPIASALSGADEDARNQIKQSVCEKVQNGAGEYGFSLDWSSWVAGGVKS